VTRALTFHQYSTVWPGLDSDPLPNVRRLSLLLVLACSGGFSPGVPVFSLPEIPIIQIGIRPGAEDPRENQLRLTCAASSPNIRQSVLGEKSVLSEKINFAETNS